ncbi:MAG: 4-hydroxythreonine-4-phosphate dehydrogenase PdxA [Bacteroidales bacterium]|jgi:4-hydroxythreonine-4-phosphate dehydrogenase|nr:4-hydroxythreonine-4-phosphate dehydrogenase PdxA [Bacteroidales bacterium]MDD3272871.1 4-hydroxythreonine-4-phosphate dehydrogenase PdxA [Bacteroidales bacterium]MDD4057961.1 4-hydroxythreonine-4-phosphate dehydrogenase PdxA [Bacteroidales bacterium]
MNNKIVVGITQGDSNGISYEVIIKSLSDNRILELCTPVVYGSSKLFGFYKKMVDEAEGVSVNVITSPSDIHHKRVNIINCVPESVAAEPGKSTPESSRGAFLSLDKAINHLKTGGIDVLVTAPFNKASMQAEGFTFPGHTEYLTSEFERGDSLMFMVSSAFKIGVVTNHIPLKDVPGAISAELIAKKCRIMANSLKRDFGIEHPKIAVLSLNPHSGERGVLGREEIDIIIPAIEELKSEGELVFGPYSSDSFFASSLFKKFDAILAMYHDQGLTPFKTLSYDGGVNFTAGLPVVRTSPDHGTAYEIAGKNIANHSSMLNAIYTAIDIFKNRVEYDEIRKNPLKVEIPVSRGND